MGFGAVLPGFQYAVELYRVQQVTEPLNASVSHLQMGPECSMYVCMHMDVCFVISNYHSMSETDIICY